MTAGGMSGDHQLPLVAPPQKNARRPNLADDCFKRYGWTQVVSDQRHRNAALVGPARQVGEQRRLEKPPIAAVNEYRDMIGTIVRWPENIHNLSCTRAIRYVEFSVPRRHRPCAIGSGVGYPLVQDLRCFRDPGPIVVLYFDLALHRRSPRH